MAESNQSNEIKPLSITIAQAVEAVIFCIRAKKVAMLHGSPAIGKSAIVHAIAEQFNLCLLDVRLSQTDPTELNGFPFLIAAINRGSYTPMDTFPIEGDAYPINPITKQPYAGWLLFFDEATSALQATQAASYKIILDRKVGQYKLHSNVAIVCAGNLETDNAIVEPMSTAMQSRLVHFLLEPDLTAFTLYASHKKWDHRIVDFVNYCPQYLYSFKPDHTDWTYSSPRTWEFVNDFLSLQNIQHPLMLPIIAGCITEGVAREFIVFCKIYDNLPKIADMIAHPENTRVSEEPSILYATCGAIANHATQTNVGALMKYVLRLPIEFQAICMRMLLNRNKAFLDHESLQEWIAKNAVELYPG